LYLISELFGDSRGYGYGIDIGIDIQFQSSTTTAALTLCSGRFKGGCGGGRPLYWLKFIYQKSPLSRV